MSNKDEEKTGRPTRGWTEETINSFTKKSDEGVEIEVEQGQPEAMVRSTACTDNKWQYCGQCTWKTTSCAPAEEPEEEDDGWF